MAKGNKTSRAPQIAGSRFARKDLGEDFIDQIEDDDDDDPTAAGAMAQIICLYNGAAVRFTIAGRNYRMKYGDVKEIEVGYTSLRQTQPGADPLPSVIEMYTNRKVLPVADPRVPKDRDGVPTDQLAALERAAQAAKAAQPAGPAAKGQPGA